MSVKAVTLVTAVLVVLVVIFAAIAMWGLLSRPSQAEAVTRTDTLTSTVLGPGQLRTITATALKDVTHTKTLVTTIYTTTVTRVGLTDDILMVFTGKLWWSHEDEYNSGRSTSSYFRPASEKGKVTLKLTYDGPTPRTFTVGTAQFHVYFYSSRERSDVYVWDSISWDARKMRQISSEKYVNLYTGFDLYVLYIHFEIHSDVARYDPATESIYFELEVSEVYP